MDDDASPVPGLVAAAAAGDQAAWNEIVERYTPLLVAVISRCGLTGAGLEDVAQTVWLRVIEHLPRLREPRALPKWIVTTARREAVQVQIGAARAQPHDPHGPTWARIAGDDPEPDSGVLLAERREVVLAALGTLSSRQRELLLLLSEDPPIPYIEISRRTGIPVGAIGPTRSRALQRLRREPSVNALAVGGVGQGVTGDPETRGTT